MHFGVAIFPTDESIHPVELGRLVEEHEVFESLWFPEHTHIPASRATPYPAGGELPHEYSRLFDPLMALAAVAAVTTRVRLGTGLVLPTQRDPIVTAKEVATLDVLSGGRVLFGVGAGWNKEELRNHGTDPARRFRLLRERVEAMQAIWTQEEASYHGELVDFEAIWSWPKPVQKPYPPVLVGGNGPRVLDRVLRYGDEWMPNRIRGLEDHMYAQITELHRRAAAEGRTVGVTLNVGPTKAGELEPWERAGVTRCVWMLRPASRDETAAKLGRLAGLAREYRRAGG